MALEVSQHQHRVVIDNAFAHCDFFKVESVTNRQIDITVLIHDIDRAESPAVNFKGLSMVGSILSSAAVQGIRFNDRAVRNGLLQSLNHVTRKNIGTVRFSGVQFDRHFPVNFFIDQVIKLDQRSGINHRRKVNLSHRAFNLLSRDILRADNRCLLN